MPALVPLAPKSLTGDRFKKKLKVFSVNSNLQQYSFLVKHDASEESVNITE